MFHFILYTKEALIKCHIKKKWFKLLKCSEAMHI